ncbi:hypothetical protein AB0442_28455 [Kitasatospora sp. NPDC085895]|uniref:hypothetical protein n=1 Tax=Kitasatospora sp. NPDC085895 TaxID=3155057 RepID=UPI00344DF3B5
MHITATELALLAVVGTVAGTLAGAGIAYLGSRAEGRRQDAAEARAARRHAYSALLLTLTTCKATLMDRVSLFVQASRDSEADWAFILPRARVLQERSADQLQAVDETFAAVLIEGPREVGGAALRAVTALYELADLLNRWTDAGVSRLPVREEPDAEIRELDMLTTKSIITVTKFISDCRRELHPGSPGSR